MWPFKKKNDFQIIQVGDDKNNLRVWVFAEPFEALEPMWDTADIIPPEKLIEDADDHLGLKGHLIDIMPDIFPFDKLPRMEAAQRRSLLDEVADGKQWMRFTGHSELVTYNVIVMIP